MAARPNSPSQHFAKVEGILLKTLMEEEEVAMGAKVMTTLRVSTSKVLEETMTITRLSEINNSSIIGSLFRIRRN